MGIGRASEKCKKLFPVTSKGAARKQPLPGRAGGWGWGWGCTGLRGSAAAHAQG